MLYTENMNKPVEEMSTPALIAAITHSDIIRDGWPTLDELTAEFRKRYYAGDAIAREWID